MNAPRAGLAVWFGMLSLAACGDRSDPARVAAAPSFAAGGIGRPSVLVNPNSDDHGTAKTIQEGIDMVAEGGEVMVVPGTYVERIVIDKGLTLEGIGGESGDVVIVSPPGLPNATVELATPRPVTIRDLTVLMSGVNGILGNGVVDVTVESLRMITVAAPLGVNRLVRIVNNASQTGGRARLVARESLFDGSAVPQALAISLFADIDALVEGNVIRRMGGACIFVQGRRGLPGDLRVDIVNNDLDECHAASREGGAIDVGPVAMPVAPPTTTGIVNIVANTIRNSGGLCSPTTAIRYEIYSGRVERNSIIGFIQPCAQPIVQALPAAIWVGSIRGFAPASPAVRFNDIQGNAHAGLRIAPNITTPLDATCNWWGSAEGPSGAGLTGTGDAVVVETGGATPTLSPFAPAPIAGRGATSC